MIRPLHSFSAPFSDLRDKNTAIGVAPELYVVLRPELKLMVVLFLIW